MELPNLQTRDEVQGYLRELSVELRLPITDPKFAAALDSRDQLAGFRNKFYIPKIGELLDGRSEIAEDVNPDDECIYMIGHSLGLQPKNALGFITNEVDKWGKKGAYGHWDGQYPWLPIEDLVQEESARIVGAKPIEVITMNASTVNIHMAMVPFYRPTQQRYKILIEKGAFPSDIFAVESQLHWHGINPKDSMILVEPREGEYIWRTEDILNVIEEHGDTIALVFLSGGVHYETGHVFDMKAITEVAHKKGCYVGYDLAHTIGNIELKLHEWEVDVAIWCTYKYTNGGPGSPGGMFVHEKYAYDFDRPRLLGWWSHQRESRMEMSDILQLQPGAAGFQISNPPVFSLMPLVASLEIFKETSMADLCRKSRILTGYLELLIEENLSSEENSPSSEGESKCKKTKGHVTIVTSKNLQKRGCQLSIQFSCPLASIKEFITTRGAAVDCRGNNMRCAPVPMYNSFTDVQRLYSLLELALETV